MLNFIKRLFGEPEEGDDLEWLQRVWELKRQFDDINLAVQNAMMGDSVEDLLGAFDRASTEMPELLRKLEALPPKSERRRRSFTVFLEGLTAYKLACDYSKKSLEENDDVAYRHAVKHMKDAGQLMKQAGNLLKR